MAKDERMEFYVRLLREKHKDLVTASANLLVEMGRENREKKIAAAQVALNAARDLRIILSSNDVPQWLPDLINSAQTFIGGGWSSSDFLGNFIGIKRRIEQHKWVFDEGGETAFDFDSIFEHYKNESRLPELFDQIVNILENIESSGEVDSITMINALAKVIATIKRCKDGSYFSLNSAWEFLLSFLKNYMWGELSKLPVLGTAMDALRKTIEETNEEMFKLHLKVEQEMNRTVEAEVKSLSHKSSFKFLEYSKNGHVLPERNNLLANAEA